MVHIITDYGYCYGVEEAIKTLETSSKKYETLFLNHPLLHNKKENDALMRKYHARYFKKGLPYDDKAALVLSAHGHTLEEEEEGKKSVHLVDATCPLIKKRYQSIPKKEEGVSYIYLGKEHHQETLGFVSRFPYFDLFDADMDISVQFAEYPLKKKSVFVPQTTVSYETYEIVLTYLKENSDVIFSLPICPLYERRAKQAIAALKEADLKNSYLIVCGDKSSSNANEIFRSIKKEYPALEGDILLEATPELKERLKNKEIYIASATSVSKETVEALCSSLS